MAFQFILNELSYQPIASDAESAIKRMDLLIDTIHRARKEKEPVRTDQYLNELVIANDFKIRDWLTDSRVDKVKQAYFRNLLTTYPALKGEEVTLYNERAELEEVTLEGERHLVLDYAYFFDGILISILSSERWNRSQLPIMITHIQDPDEKACLRHLAKPEHVKDLQLDHELINSGADLAERVTEFYPNLRFCRDALKQLSEIKIYSRTLQLIMERLDELQKYSSTWKSDRFNPSHIGGRVNPESQATLDQYGSDHEFLSPDGIERRFSWHIRYSGACRIYFFPRDQVNEIHIGYFGHLPTVKYPRHIGIEG